jgi:hypothetical protein
MPRAPRLRHHQLLVSSHASLHCRAFAGRDVDSPSTGRVALSCSASSRLSGTQASSPMCAKHGRSGVQGTSLCSR